MNDRSADTRDTWSTDLVEKVIKQPVRDAVQEALAEQDVVRTDDAETEEKDTSETTETAEASDTAESEDAAATTEGGDDDTTGSGRSRGLSFALLAGTFAGIAYAIRRRRQAQTADDEQTDDEEETDKQTADDETDETEQSDTDSDADLNGEIRDAEGVTATESDAAAK